MPHDESKTLKLEMHVFEYEEDMFENLTLSNLMRKLQEISSYDITILGYTHEEILQQGFILVLAWSSIEIVRDLKIREKLTFCTSPRVGQGARMYRDIWVEDEQGERVVEANTVWTCIDSENRSIVNHEDLPIPYKLQEKTIQIPDAKKIRLRKNMPFLGERQAYFSDMDVNRHINNCRYADLFCDFIGVDFENYRIGRFRINYRKEIYMGQTVKFYGEVEETHEGLLAHMVGEAEGAPCFLVEAELFPIDRTK